MAFKKQEAVEQVAAHSHEDLEKKVASLEKEVADLKKELSKAKGGADPRVDSIISLLKLIHSDSGSYEENSVNHKKGKLLIKDL